MTFKRVTPSYSGDTQHSSGDDWNKISDYLSDVDISATDVVKIATQTTFRDQKLLIRNPANTYSYTIQTSAITGNRNIILPTTTGTDTLVCEAMAQALTNKTITTPVLDSYVDYNRITAPANPAADKGRVYVKQIDSNNDGLFILIKRAGSYVEVQLA